MSIPVGLRLFLFATRPDQDAVLAASPVVTAGAGHRYEFYLLGTSSRNAKLIVLDRRVSV